MLNLNWNIIWTFVNIIVLFLLLRIFLFKPVMKILDKRADEIKKTIDDADAAKREASELKAKYSEELKAAGTRADAIIKEATDNAKIQREKILDKAKKDADNIIKTAEKQTELDKQQAMKEMRSQIADVALKAAHKAMESGDISENSIGSFLRQVGESDD